MMKTIGRTLAFLALIAIMICMTYAISGQLFRFGAMVISSFRATEHEEAVSYKVITDEAKEKIRISTRKYNLIKKDYVVVSDHHKGSKLLNNGIEQHWFYKEDVEQKLSEGWVIGACKKRKPKQYKNGVNPLIGRKRKPTTKDTVGINNGEINRFVPKSELDRYLSDGWTLGMKKRTNSQQN